MLCYELTYNHCSRNMQTFFVSEEIHLVGIKITLKLLLTQPIFLPWRFSRLICKKRSVGTPSAEGARIDAPQAPSGVGVGRGIPLPTGGGVLWGGYAPSREIFWNFHPKMVSFGAIRSAVCNVSQPAFTRKLKLQQHTVLYPTIIPLTPICLTYSFWSVNPAAYGFWLLVVPFLHHSVIPQKFYPNQGRI